MIKLRDELKLAVVVLAIACAAAVLSGCASSSSGQGLLSKRPVCPAEGVRYCE